MYKIINYDSGVYMISERGGSKNEKNYGRPEPEYIISLLQYILH